MTTSSPSLAHIAPQVRLEQIRLLLGGMRSSLVPGLLLAALLTWSLWPTAPLVWLQLWCVAVMAGRLVNVAHAELTLRRGPVPDEAGRLTGRLMLLNTYEGLAWGALPWIALDSATSAGSVLIIASMAGIVGNALSLLASVGRVFLCFAGSLLGLVLIKLWLLDDPAYEALAMAGVLYLAGLLGWARNAWQSARASILLRFENLDLVGRLQAEWEKAQAAQQQAEQANQAKSRFLAAASHDLRQPVHALGLFLDVLARGRPDDRAAVLENAAAAQQAAAEMLDTLLDFSRIEAGVITPRHVVLPLQPLLYKLEKELAYQADAKGIVYRSRETRLHVLSDPALLELMLRNLIANAIRYTERGGLLIGCRRRGATVQIDVYDTGIGIPPDQQQAVFLEFHQLGNPERDRRKGLGLGLAITQGLARSLGHELTLASRPGRGSLFRLHLPLARPSALGTSHTLAVSPPVHGQLAGRRVLVLDDDEAVRLAMQQLLIDWGCLCAVAESLEQALEQARRQPPELIVSDYRLRGETNGAEAIARLREALGRALPALILTGDTAPQRLREVARSGIPLLHKPVSPARLNQALLECLAEVTAATPADTAAPRPGEPETGPSPRPGRPGCAPP